MGINVYLEEIEKQRTYVYDLATTYQTYLDELRGTMNLLFYATLEGEGYDAIREYFASEYIPLMNGLKMICVELMDAHYYFVEGYRSEVHDGNSEELVLLDLIERLKYQITNAVEIYHDLTFEDIYLEQNINLMQLQLQMLEERLYKLYDFQSSSPSYFESVLVLIEHVDKGIKAISENAGWDELTGKYDKSKVDLGWAKELDVLWNRFDNRLSIIEIQLREEQEELEKKLKGRTYSFVEIVNGARVKYWVKGTGRLTKEDIEVTKQYEEWIDKMISMYGSDVIYGTINPDPLVVLSFEMRTGVEYKTGRNLSDIEKLQRRYTMLSMAATIGLSSWWSVIANKNVTRSFADDMSIEDATRYNEWMELKRQGLTAEEISNLREFGSTIVAGNLKTQGSGNQAKGEDLHHVFDDPEHNLDGYLNSQGGNQNNAFNAVQNEAQKYADKFGYTRGQDIIVNVNGFNITVRGNMVNGVFRIGTFFIP